MYPQLQSLSTHFMDLADLTEELVVPQLEAPVHPPMTDAATQ